MHRIHGARLAVPLTIASIILLLIGLDLRYAPEAGAIDRCRPTSNGIVCGFSGSSSTRSTSVSGGRSSRAPSRTPVPPLRYLRTSGGRCWYWSRYPPGFDSWNSAYDQSIILTRWRLPQCSGRSTAAAPPVVTFDVRAHAWSVFRAFPLDGPEHRLTPTVGITNLPSRLHVARPGEFNHAETLPDGRRLEVHARVATVWVDWSDGTPTEGYTVSDTAGDPGTVEHTFLLKTCPPGYRTGNLHGGKCHALHERYPTRVTFEWSARYRVGGSWIELGTIDRSSSYPYDVDEVIGVLTGS